MMTKRQTDKDEMHNCEEKLKCHKKCRAKSKKK